MIRTTSRFSIRALLLLMLMALIASACGDDEGEGTGSEDPGGESIEAIDVPIGVIGSHSGPFAAFGAASYGGVNLAVEEINETGFEVGDQLYRFVVHEADARSEPSTATAEARRLVEEHDPIAVFGPTISGLAVPILDITQPESILHISAASGVQAVLVEDPESVPYVVISNNTYGGEGGVVTRIAEEAYARGVESVVLLVPDDATGRTIGPLFVEGFENAGGEVLAEEYIPGDTSDFQPFLSRFADMEPDGLLMGYSDAYNIALMTQARQADFADWYIVPAGGSATVGSEDSGSELYEHYMFSSTIGGLEDPTPEVEEYIAAYEASTGESINSTSWASAFSYPFVYALMEAMQAAGTVDDPDAILAALKSGTYSPPGPVPELSVDDTGIARATYNICDLVGGSPNCTAISPS